MAFAGGKTSPLVFLAIVFLFAVPQAAVGETYECTVETIPQEQRPFCVFSNVNYTTATKNIAFKAPAGKHPLIAFQDSEMEHLPREFLEKFGNDLKVLSVVGCKLKSVVITKSMEELIAIDNYIERVIVHQQAASSPMKVINLQSNRLSDISNITKNCKNVNILDLSRNEELAKESEIDLSMFNGMNELQYLMLADVGALYLKNDAKPNLPSLTLLDLSMNNLIPNDVHWDNFKVFTSLEVLRLNDIGMSQFDYGHLTLIKSLKNVYLEGNSFDCKYLKRMIEFLNEKNINTPVGRPAQNCHPGFDIVEQMCCKSDALSMRPIRPEATPATEAPRYTEPSKLPETPSHTNIQTVTTKPMTTTTTLKTFTGNGVQQLHFHVGFVLLSFLVAAIARN